MKTENTTLMDMAQTSLKGNWGMAIGTGLVYWLIIGSPSIFTHFNPSSRLYFTILSFIITGPFLFGITQFSLTLSRNQYARFEQLFDGLDQFIKYIGAYLLIGLYTILWTILLIIPGIIAALSYSMTFFILADDPEIGVIDAIYKSIDMMKGYKWKLFCLHLFYMLLTILCIATLGIGFLWLFPFIHVTNAKFYDDIKKDLSSVENSNPAF